MTLNFEFEIKMPLDVENECNLDLKRTNPMHHSRKDVEIDYFMYTRTLNMHKILIYIGPEFRKVDQIDSLYPMDAPRKAVQKFQI